MKVTERGIGNGISHYYGWYNIPSYLLLWEMKLGLLLLVRNYFISEIVLMGIMFLVICFVVLLTQGTRKIPVQYAKESSW